MCTLHVHFPLPQQSGCLVSACLVSGVWCVDNDYYLFCSYGILEDSLDSEECGSDTVEV